MQWNLLISFKNGKFDFVFIDADKTGYPAYFDKVIEMMNSGGIIAADNTLRKGAVVKPDSELDEGTKALKVYNNKVANDSRVESLLVPISDGLTICYVKMKSHFYKGKVRATVMCIFRSEDKILVCGDYDPVKNETFLPSSGRRNRISGTRSGCVEKRNYGRVQR